MGRGCRVHQLDLETCLRLRSGMSARGTAGPRGAHRPLTPPPFLWKRMWPLAAINGGPIRSPFAKSRQWRCQKPWPGPLGGVLYTHTCGEWNLSFRNKCWKCSSKKGQAVEVVLGVPDPAANERSESEGSQSDREEQTADRIAEKLGLTQFLRRRNKRRGGRGRDRGHPKSEAAPKRGRGGGRGAGAGGAAGLAAGVIAVSMVPRSGGPGLRAPSALMLPPQLPQLPAFGPPHTGRSFAGRRRDARARGSSVLRGLAEVIAYTWATTRFVRNRLMHILTGNGPSSVVYILSLALVAPVFWDVHKNLPDHRG